MQTVLLVAFFGAVGCVSRYALSGAVYQLLGRGFPYGTLAVNVLGSFIIGLLMEFSTKSALLTPSLRTGLTIGLLGGLTTFSTFSFETFRLLEDGELLVASANIVTNVLFCLFFTWIGMTVARTL